MTRWIVLLGLVFASFAIAVPASAQQSGDTIIFIVPAGTAVTTGSEGDKVIYIGKPLGFMVPGDCAPADTTPRPVQNVILVDAGSGQRATRTSGLVTLFTNVEPRTNAIPNGTRLAFLVTQGSCSVGDTSYDKYSGTVE